MIKAPIVQCSANHASRLIVMRTISKTTLARENLYIDKCLSKTIIHIPELDFTHSWGIDHKATAGKNKKLAMRGSMPPFAVDLPNLPHSLQVAAQQVVDESRLADTRRAKKSHRDTFFQIVRHNTQALSRDNTYRMNRHSRRAGANNVYTRIHIGTLIALCKQDNRFGATLPGQSKITLGSGWTKIIIQTHHDKHRVDVRCYGLSTYSLSGFLS